jgi:hypothetical protein
MVTQPTAEGKKTSLKVSLNRPAMTRRVAPPVAFNIGGVTPRFKGSMQTGEGSTLLDTVND